MTTILRGAFETAGFTGSYQCHQSPFPITPHVPNGRLLLGNVTINSTVSWLVPAGVEVIGLGALSTTIAAATGFSAPHLVEMGNGSVQFGVKIKGLTVDCAGFSGCVGIYNDIAEEDSIVEDVIINNAPTTGLEVDLPGCPNIPPGPQAANSGAYRNVTIQYPGCSNCGSATGVLVCGSDAGQIVRGLDNITVNSCNISNSATKGIVVGGASTRITNSTISCSNTGILIQDTLV